MKADRLIRLCHELLDYMPDSAKFEHTDEVLSLEERGQVLLMRCKAIKILDLAQKEERALEQGCKDPDCPSYDLQGNFCADCLPCPCNPNSNRKADNDIA